MQLFVILLFLQMWTHVEVSLSQNACSTLPDVPHAHVSEDTRKAQYQEGDIIHFACEPGYLSSQTAKSLCTRDGWLSIRPGKCFSCSRLPDVTHAYITEDTKKSEYQEGDMIHFTCEPGYTSGAIIKYVCMSDGWLPAHQGTCSCDSLTTTAMTTVVDCCHATQSLGCDLPPVDGGVTVKGLPENGLPIPPDHTITFSCDDPGKYLNGSSVLVCGENGQWDNPFPSCEGITCSVDVVPPHLSVADLPAAHETLKSGHRLRFTCDSNYELEGAQDIECLQTGQWSAPFPTCAENCIVPAVPNNIRITPYVRSNQRRKGQSVRFSCRYNGHVIHGKAVVQCLAGGQWSDPFPTCGAFGGCQIPPYLENGDTRDAVKYQYSHGEAVEYICQSYYTLEGQSYKSCINGKWIGQMRCLRPCIVDRENINKHNIDFKYVALGQLYVMHNYVTEFRCIGKTRFDGVSSMRQRCVDGVIQLPTCH